MLLADYQSFLEVQEMAAAAFGDQERWTRMSIHNAARCGFFSSDRAIGQYCAEIWGVKPVKVD
jgi:starch phosphorylase